VFGFLEDYAKYNQTYSVKDGISSGTATSISEDLKRWLVGKMWNSQTGLIRNIEGRPEASADAQTRWIRFLGVQRFEETFGMNDAQFVEYLNRIEVTFGVTVDYAGLKDVKLLDLADASTRTLRDGVAVGSRK